MPKTDHGIEDRGSEFSADFGVRSGAGIAGRPCTAEIHEGSTPEVDFVSVLKAQHVKIKRTSSPFYFSFCLGANRTFRICLAHK